MNFLKHIWPWSRFADYEWRLKERAQRVDELKKELDFHRHEHSWALARLQEEKERHEVSKNGLRHIATTLALRGNFDKLPVILVLLFVCFSGFAGTPVLPTLLTTNPTPLLSSISGPIVTTNGSGKPELTYNASQLTNIFSSNVVSAVLAWPGPSNAVTVYHGFSDWFYASATPVSLTNCVGAIAGYNLTMDLCISNSSAATFTNFCTIPNATYVGQNGNNQGTNELTIASGKQGYWHVETRGVNRTNVYSTIEQ